MLTFGLSHLGDCLILSWGLSQVLQFSFYFSTAAGYEVFIFYENKSISNRCKLYLSIKSLYFSHSCYGLCCPCNIRSCKFVCRVVLEVCRAPRKQKNVLFDDSAGEEGHLSISYPIFFLSKLIQIPTWCVDWEALVVTPLWKRTQVTWGYISSCSRCSSYSIWSFDSACPDIPTTNRCYFLTVADLYGHLGDPPTARQQSNKSGLSFNSNSIGCRDHSRWANSSRYFC